MVRSLREGDAVPLTGEQVTVVVHGATRREVVQAVRRSGGRLRLDFLAPPGVVGQVVLDDGRAYRHFKPRLRVLEEGESRLARTHAQQQRQLAQILRGRIAVQEEREELVAGRRARVVLLTPPRGGRPRRLWLDRELAVQLKVEETGPAGQTISTAFRRIDLNPQHSDGDFILQVPAGTQVIPAGLGRPVTVIRARGVAQSWGGLYQLAALPPGFAFRAAFITRLNQKVGVVLVYGSGPQTLSFFQGPGAAVPKPGALRGVNVVGKVIQDVPLALAGPLPHADLQRVLDSAGR